MGSIVQTAHADFDAFSSKHEHDFEAKMAAHQGSSMYLGEVFALAYNRGGKEGDTWRALSKAIHDKGLRGRAQHAGLVVASADIDARKDKGNDAAVVRNVIEQSSNPDHELYLERYLYDLHGDPRFGTPTPAALKPLDQIGDGTVRAHIGLALGKAEVEGLIPAASVVRMFTSKPNDTLIGNAEATTQKSTRDARGRLDEARQELQKLDDKLERELRDVGPALWDPNEKDHGRVQSAQRRVNAYIEDFHSSHEYLEAKKRVDDGVHALHLELGAHGADLDAHAGAKNGGKSRENAAGVLVHSYSELAAQQSSYRDLAMNKSTAKEALLWALAHESDPRFKHGEVLSVSKLAQANIANAALEGVGSIMRNEHKSAKERIVEAIEKIESLVKPYHIGSGVAALRELGETFAEIRKHLSGMRNDLGSSAAKELSRIAKALNGKQDALGACDVLCVRISAGIGLMIEVVDDTNKTTVTTTVGVMAKAQYFYQRVDDFHKLASTGEPHAHGPELTARAKAVHAAYADFARATTMFAMVGGALAISEDINEIKIGGDPILAIKLVADLASVMGNAIAMFPPLAPIGEAISLVGTLVSMIAAGFIGRHEDGERREEERERLDKESILGEHAETLAPRFTEEHSASALEAAQKWGLTVGQIRRLGMIHPNLFKDVAQMDGAGELFAFLKDGHNQGAIKATFNAPYSNSLFEFLNRPYGKPMTNAFSLAGNNHASKTQMAVDLRDRMIDSAKKGMPHAFTEAGS